MDEIKSLEAEIAQKETELKKARDAKLKGLMADEKKQATVVARAVKKADSAATKLKKAKDAVKGNSPTAAQAQKIAGAKVESDEATAEKRDVKIVHRQMKADIADMKHEIRVADRAMKARDDVIAKERRKQEIKEAKKAGIDATKPGRKPRKKKIRMIYVPVVPSSEAIKAGK